jgi:hypothetical protein
MIQAQSDAQSKQQDGIQKLQAEGASQTIQAQKVQADQAHQANLEQGKQRHEISLKAIDMLNAHAERKHREMLASKKPQKAGVR